MNDVLDNQEGNEVPQNSNEKTPQYKSPFWVVAVVFMSKS